MCLDFIVPYSTPTGFCRKRLSTGTLLCLAAVCMQTLFSQRADLHTDSTWELTSKKATTREMLILSPKFPFENSRGWGERLTWFVSRVHPAPASCVRWTESQGCFWRTKACCELGMYPNLCLLQWPPALADGTQTGYLTQIEPVRIPRSKL